MSDESNHIREQIDIGGCVDESMSRRTNQIIKRVKAIRCLQLKITRVSRR